MVSYETVLKFIRTTRSATGFRCLACLDTKTYPKGLKVRPEEMACVRLRPRRVLPQWNYTIWPHITLAMKILMCWNARLLSG